MLAPNSVIKSTAKLALSSRFLHSVAVCCVLIFAWFACVLSATLALVAFETIGFFVTILLCVLFVIFPLFLGALYYFKRLIFQQEDNPLIIFKYFSSFAEYKRALRFSLSYCLKFALFALLTYSPCIIIATLANEKIYQLLNITLPIWVSNLWTLNSFVAILSTILLIFITLKYYLSPFIFVSNENVTAKEAINLSTVISKRTGGDFFGLVLSFFPLLLLSVFVAPLVFTLPYFLASYAVHCRFAITTYNLDVERFSTVSAPSFTADGI